MPFKSQAQRRKFYAMAGRGEISKKTVKKWESHTPKKKLPERVKKSAFLQGFLYELEKHAGKREDELEKLLGPMYTKAPWLKGYRKKDGQGVTIASILTEAMAGGGASAAS